MLGAELTRTTDEAAPSGTPRVIPFDTVVRADTGFTTTTGAAAGVTIPETGWYDITARVVFAVPLAASGGHIEIQNAGTGQMILSSMSLASTTPNHNSTSVAGVAYLTAGTKLVTFMVSPVSTTQIGGGADNRTYMRVVSLVGVRGAPGATGATGPSGGPQGPAGATGPQGLGAGVTVLSNLWQPIFPWTALAQSVVFPSYAVVTRIVLASAIKAVGVSTGTAGGSLRVVAYEDTPAGPGALVAQSATFTAATGVSTTALALSPGAYWLGVWNVQAPGGTNWNSFAVTTGGNPFMTGTDLPTATSVYYNAWQVVNQGTTVKDPFPTTGITRDGKAPGMYVQGA